MWSSSFYFNIFILFYSGIPAFRAQCLWEAGLETKFFTWGCGVGSGLIVVDSDFIGGVGPHEDPRRIVGE